MKKVHIKKGLDLPAEGAITANDIQNESDRIKEVALLGPDYVGMKPTLLVKEGDAVEIGTPLFEDKKNPGIIFTSPAAGSIKGIHRGEKRVFESLVIKREVNEARRTFSSFQSDILQSPSEKDARSLLVESGLWTALRTRPYDKIPAVDAKTRFIFVTATDSNPLAAEPALVIRHYQEDFDAGLRVLAKLAPKVFVCVSESFPEDDSKETDPIEKVRFTGPHPSGLVGTHIHFLAPAHKNNTVWHIGYQDVIAIGKLFKTGELWVERVVALTGPLMPSPRLVKTRLGGRTSDMLKEINPEKAVIRLVSGSMLFGRSAQGPFDYLGRFHIQVTALENDTHRELLGWQGPGFDTFSVKPLFLSKFLPGKTFSFTSSTNGSPRAIVPVGAYEKVMPLDLLATPLLKALCTKDTENSEKLGALELGEEDLSLCTFVCSGKKDYGQLLRNVLADIERGL